MNEQEEAMDITDDSAISDNDEKSRSLSTSRISKSEEVAATIKDGSKRSFSATRSDASASTNKTTPQGVGKKKNKASEIGEVFSKDPFIDMLEEIKREKGIPTITEEQHWAMQRKKLQTLLKEGSELKLKDLNRKAVDKYKCALGMILDHSLKTFRLMDIDFIVLKYSLSTSLLELSFSDIIKAIEYLTEIQTNAKAFPAVYYGLGKAYKRLNRFKAAVEYLEKGYSFLKREVKFETQSWPETNIVIPESTREGLQELIENMLKESTVYHEPDAICKYSNCRNISTHIIPSEHIFYSDPEFCGFVIVNCEEKCRVEYHVACWKDYKDKSTNEVGKLSDKEFIGRECPTDDCFTLPNNRSVIIKIEVVGDDAMIKSTIESSRAESTAVKEKILSKKKKPDMSLLSQPKIKPAKKQKKQVEMVKPVVTQEVSEDNTVKEMEERMKKLEILREINFGCLKENNWDPRRPYFSHLDVHNLDHFLSPEYPEETEKDRMEKDFVFSYFFEFLKKYGPQKITEVEKKWKAEYNDFNLEKITTSNESICPVLLQSYRFAAIEDYICVSEQSPDAYKLARTSIVETVTALLSGTEDGTDSSNGSITGIYSHSDDVQSSLEDIHLLQHSSNDQLAHLGEILADKKLHSSEKAAQEYSENDKTRHSEKCLKPQIDGFRVTVPAEFEETGLKSADKVHPTDKMTAAESASTVSSYIPEDNHNLQIILPEQNFRDISSVSQLQLQPHPVIKVRHHSVQTEEDYLHPEVNRLQKKVEQLIAQFNKMQIEAKKSSDEYLKKDNNRVQMIEKLSQNKQELEKELTKLKLQKSEEIKALKESIVQKTKEVEDEKKKLSLEKASCEELTRRISEIISETGRISDELKASEEKLNRMKAVALMFQKSAVANVQGKGDLRINSCKQKCHDRLQILRCMLTCAEGNAEKKPEILSDIKSWEAYLLNINDYASKSARVFQSLNKEIMEKPLSSTLETVENLKFPEEPTCTYSTVEEMIIWITADNNKTERNEDKTTISETNQHEQKPVNNLNTQDRSERSNENYTKNINAPLISGPPPPLLYNYGNTTGMPIGPSLYQSVFQPSHQYMYTSNMNYRPPAPMHNMHQQATSLTSVHSPWMAIDNQVSANMEKQEADSKSSTVNQMPKMNTPPPVQQNGFLPIGGKKGNEPEIVTSAFKSEKISSPLPQPSTSKGPSPPLPLIKPTMPAPSAYEPNAVNAVAGSVTMPVGKSSNYKRLMKHLHRIFPTKTEEELAECVIIARQRNNNSLSQLKLTTISSLIEKILKEKGSKKQGVVGLEKFGGSAWGEVPTDTVSSWSKPQDDVEECIICMEPIRDNKIQLQCKHTFHSKCIKNWLRTNSICPVCREFTRLVDEYPPLS